MAIDMNIAKRDISDGLDWYACGWKIFQPQWLMWIVAGLIFIGISIACMLIPLIGSFIYHAAMPALLAGLMHAAREVERGKELDAGFLFEGFRDPERRTPLLILGSVWLGCVIVGTIVFFAIVGTSTIAAIVGQDLQSEAMRHIGLSLALGLLVMLAIQLLGAMALFYSVPLVMFDKVPPLEAIQASFRACMVNFLPLLIYGLALIVLGVLAMLPLFLGLLVLVPWSFCANYCSYKAVFGK